MSRLFILAAPSSRTARAFRLFPFTRAPSSHRRGRINSFSTANKVNRPQREIRNPKQIKKKKMAITQTGERYEQPAAPRALAGPARRPGGGRAVQARTAAARPARLGYLRRRPGCRQLL